MNARDKLLGAVRRALVEVEGAGWFSSEARAEALLDELAVEGLVVITKAEQDEAERVANASLVCAWCNEYDCTNECADAAIGQLDELRTMLQYRFGPDVEVNPSENGEDDWVYSVYASLGDAYALCDLGSPAGFWSQVEFLTEQLIESGAERQR